jgi:hypothetical protein
MSDSPTQMDFEEHFEHCEGSLYDGDDFVTWLAQHDADVARAERERLLALLPKHMPKTQEEQWAHEEVCYWCANFAGLGIAWKILEGGDDANPEWLSSP